MKGSYILGFIEAKDKKTLETVEFLKKAVSRICKAIGLKIVGERYHVFKSPNGITYCFILSQSHFIIHTWPEESKLYFDIFTCNKEVDTKQCANALSKEFKGRIKDIKKIDYK